jgi:hypothetical protein
MAITGHHARLGTRLRARLCRGYHLRQLNSMRFQGATLIEPNRQADFPHLALGKDSRGYVRRRSCMGRRAPTRNRARAKAGYLIGSEGVSPEKACRAYQKRCRPGDCPRPSWSHRIRKVAPRSSAIEKRHQDLPLRICQNH